MRIAILKPNNQLIQGTYPKIREVCINECLKDENISDFIDFQQQYNYFEPYFDYVMFKLKYIIINPLYQKSTAISAVGNNLYKTDINILDYNKITKDIQEEMMSVNKLPLLSKSSDEELDIEKEELETIENIKTCLLDPNNIALLNSMGSENGSHGITANTILNQLLLISPKINQDFIETIKKEEYEDNTVITYLSNKLGFMRITDKKTYPTIIANELSINEEQKESIARLKSAGFHYFDLETKIDNFNDLYKELISEEKITKIVHHKNRN